MKLNNILKKEEKPIVVTGKGLEEQIVKNYINKKVGSFITNALDTDTHKRFKIFDDYGVLMEIPARLENKLGYSQGYKTISDDEFISTYGASTCICLLVAHKKSKTITLGHFPSFGKITPGMKKAFTNPGLGTKLEPKSTEVHIFSGTKLKDKEILRAEEEMLNKYITELGITEIYNHTPDESDMILEGLYATDRLINFRYAYKPVFVK